MSRDILQEIQTLQFSDKGNAEALLLSFIGETFPLDVQAVELRPLAISLNSFNGFLTLADGKRLFFKSHTESDTVINEYYNAELLAKAGYPVIQPIFQSTQPGKQLLIYEVISDPSVFDVAWEIETGISDLLPELTQAQNQADDQLLKLYVSTLHEQSATEAASAAIHQLFYHRLVGGRLERFYGSLPGNLHHDTQIRLPDGIYSMQEIRNLRWVINGQVYSQSLNDLIQQAVQLLVPDTDQPTIVGHGDAHNGNVFFQNNNGASLLYFDPAFAGKHHPLLDLVKPLFHNVFAMWMYFPEAKRDSTQISTRRVGEGIWHIDHDYAIHDVRWMFFRSKVDRVLTPILKQLHSQGWLRSDWRSYLKMALFCCPFLTMNLTDSNKFPAEVSLLGIAMSIEMGAESQGRKSIIDQTLDEVEEALNV